MNDTKALRWAAMRAAFPYTIPIMTGFLFLGMAYGIYMNVTGFPWIYRMAMSLVIFAGSMEFVTVNLLLGAFDPIGALMLTLMVNARHLFYGLAMLEKYRNTGWKKFYLIFGMCDESFSINCTTEPPEGIDRGWFMFFVTLFNHLLGGGGHVGRPVWFGHRIQCRGFGICDDSALVGAVFGAMDEGKTALDGADRPGCDGALPGGIRRIGIYHSGYAGHHCGIDAAARAAGEKGR